SQGPLGKISRRELPRLAAEIAHTQLNQLDRIVGRDKQGQLVLDPMSLAFKDGVSLPMTHPRGVVSRDRQGSRTPCLAGRFITKVNHFRGRIDDRIVAPASQSIRLAVASPGESRPALGDEET